MTRNEKGQFAKGVSGNPAGRPRKEVEAEYLSATIGAVSLADWKEITAKAVHQAKRGDTAARKWLSDYVLGTPIQRTEHSGDSDAPVTIRVEYVRRDTDAS